jgi:hypothetical protein
VAEFEFALVAVAAHSFGVMSDRQLILEAIQQMPEPASAQEILDELLLLNDVKKRLAKSERGGRGIPHEDVVKMLDSWIAS